FLELGFSSDATFITTYWWLPFSFAGYSICAATTWGLIVLALSSMSKNSRYVGVMLISLSFFSSGMAHFLRGIFNPGGVIVVSGTDSLKILTYLFFGGVSEYGDHSIGAAVMLVLLAVASVFILRARVRAVEVVT